MKSILKKLYTILIMLLWFGGSCFGQFHTVRSGVLTESQRAMDTPVVTESLPLDTVIKQAELITPAQKEMSQRFCFPLKHIRFTSGYGMRLHPILHTLKMHSGVDLKADYEAVFAVADGIVEKAGYDALSGNVIVIRHTDNLTSVYGHLSSIFVAVAEKVSAGDIIALSGNTGRSTGPHLHFGVKYKGQMVNPEWLFRVIQNK